MASVTEHPSVAQLRTLIVEDEALIALMLQDILMACGCTISRTASTIEDARLFAGDDDFDIAIMDVRLHGEQSFPVADRIVASGRPVIFATGSDSEEFPQRFERAPILHKPYSAAAVQQAICAVTSSRSAA